MAASKQTERFEIVDAVRTNVALIMGIEGPPGGGKTFTALRMARGMQRVRPGPIVLIDTDNERAAAYADEFAFKHLILRPPFRPSRFLGAVRAANALKPAAIIVDSQSDEHEGEGGVLDFHAAELDRMAGEDWGKRERVGQAAWIKPKAERLAMINGYLQLERKTPLILCFRARQKVQQRKNERGKMEPVNIGWQPIAPAEIVSNCNVLCLLPPQSDGVPKWKTGVGEEDFVLKLPSYAKPIFAKPGALGEEHGEALARWASGDKTTTSSSSPGAGGKSVGGAGAGIAAPLADTSKAGGDPQNADVAQNASPPADDADDFPGDRFEYVLLNSKGETRKTSDGAAWAKSLIGMITKAKNDEAPAVWKRNRDHVDAARDSASEKVRAHGEAVFAAWVKRQEQGELV